MAVLNLQAFKDRIVKALTPWFLGRDQDALIEAMRQYAEETLVAVEVDTDALQDQFTNLYSNAGAGAIGTASGNSVQEELDAVGGGLAGKVNRAGDTMTGKLTNNVSIHVPSGTMVLGAPLPENLYWNYTYPGNTYLTMDKATADNDASLVFTQGGRAKWEFGATTEGPGVSPRIHMKKVNNPTANPADDQFLDVMIWDYDTGNVWVNNGYKLGIGTLPTERLHVAGFNVSGGRVVSKFENYNTGAGSQSAAHVFQGVGTSWNLGNDFGLNAGHNFFIQDGNSGNLRFFANVNGVSVGGSTVEATEILRADSTTGGFLPPRMTTVQRDAMGGKNAGLIIYNTTASALQVWNGATWQAMASGNFVTLDTGQTITGYKEFTNGEINIRGFSGDPNGGVIRWGTDTANNYQWKTGNTFRFKAGTNAEVVLDSNGGSIWTTVNLSDPVTRSGNQTITGNKTFTAQQTVDNTTINFRNWAGVGTNGLVLMGDNSYLWKAGSQFEFYNAQGPFTAVLNSGGIIWTTGNLAQPMTLDTGQTVTGGKTFTAPNGIKIRSSGLADGLDIGASPTLAGGTDPDVYLYNRNNGAIWFGTDNALRGKIRADGTLRWENEVQSTSANTYRAVFGNYGVFQRNDGSDWYFMLTNSGDQYGSWNSLRPMYINIPTGNVTFGHNIQANGNLNVVGRIDGNAQATARSRIFVKDGTDTANPGGKVMNMYYLSGIYDGGVLQTYDYAAASYKPTRFEASSWNWLENGATTKMTLDSSVPSRSLQINGGFRSYGASAQLETEDRTSGRGWTWYGTGDVMYLYNGSSNIMSMTPGGQLSPITVTASGANGAHFSGNGSGFQMNGLMYENGTTFNLAANGAVWVRNPRVFVQSGDPGAQAADGDLWFW